MKTTKEEFGKKFKNLRKNKGFSIRQVALQAGISHPYISQVENAQRDIPTPKTLRKLAKGLRISEDEMFEIAGLRGDSHDVDFSDHNNVFRYQGKELSKQDMEDVKGFLDMMRKREK